MMKLSCKTTAPKRHGIAAVEFAIVATVLVTLTVGMFEMARGMMIKETLSNAARRGCRVAILPTGSNSAVKTDVEKVLTDHNVAAGDATIQVLVNGKTADAATAKQYDKISVRISIPASKVSWITPMFLSGESIQSEPVVMMRQR